MKRILTLGLALLLTLPLLAACGNNGDGSSSPPASTGNNNTENTSPSTDSGESQNNNTSASTQPSKESADDRIKNPEVTVNPGDVVFDNEYIEIVYEGVTLLPNTLSIDFLHKRKIEQNFEINDALYGVGINGVIYTDFTNYAGSPTKFDSFENNRAVGLDINKLEENGIALEDIKTVEIIFSLRDDDFEIIWEGVAQFKVKLP